VRNSPSVAVLDIGSNSIKVLVARRAAGGNLEVVLNKSLDARISAGINSGMPRLGEEGMQRGCDAVQKLLAEARVHAPAKTLLVATSAVRDASNGNEFRARIKALTGQDVSILSGEEEANGIGRGLTADSTLAGLRNFHVFDLGGGSLECLSFQDRRVQRAVSLQLGCVRLMENFVPEPELPFSAESRVAIFDHAVRTLKSAALPLNLPDATAIGTGGTVATVRAILGAREDKPIEATPAVVTTLQLQELLDYLAPMTLEQRRRVAGMPPARADVFPVALATILAIASLGGFTELRHSFHNLRYGLAAQLLESL
jgi:exopolyphosphatase / guanosine-5'-triphosphate,3'-diphosphate pyrophosphatase